MLFCEIGSIYTSYLVLQATGLVIPSSFALGFALSRPFRRLRLPIDLAAAGLLKKAVPELSQLELSELFRGLSRTSVVVGRANKSISQAIPSWDSTMTKMGTMMDHYGASYFFASRWMGAISVLTCTGLIEYGGVDVLDSFFDYWGFNKETGSVLGSWALAVTMSSVLYPFVTVGIGAQYLAPKLGALRLAKFPATAQSPPRPSKLLHQQLQPKKRSIRFKP